jgi:hypothetical protein
MLEKMELMDELLVPIFDFHTKILELCTEIHYSNEFLVLVK